MWSALPVFCILLINAACSRAFHLSNLENVTIQDGRRRPKVLSAGQNKKITHVGQAQGRRIRLA
jgi:hypothetical protein